MLHAPDTRTGDVYTSQTLELVHRDTVWGHYQKGVQVYDAGLERKHACLQFVFPSSIGGQTSYWQ